MSIHRPRDVIVGDDQSRAADKLAPASISAGDTTCLYPDWTYDSCTPARQVYEPFDNDSTSYLAETSVVPHFLPWVQVISTLLARYCWFVAIMTNSNRFCLMQFQF